MPRLQRARKSPIHEFLGNGRQFIGQFRVPYQVRPEFNGNFMETSMSAK